MDDIYVKKVLKHYTHMLADYLELTISDLRSPLEDTYERFDISDDNTSKDSNSDSNSDSDSNTDTPVNIFPLTIINNFIGETILENDSDSSSEYMPSDYLSE